MNLEIQVTPFLRSAARFVASGMLALCTLAVPFHASAAESAAPDKSAKAPAPTLEATCRCYAVIASKNAASARVPSELAFMAADLNDDQFAAYKSFRLLEQKELKLHGSAVQAVGFSTKHRLELKLIEREDSRFKLHVNLLEAGGARPMVNLDAWIRKDGLLMFVGGSYQGDKLIFATRCTG